MNLRRLNDDAVTFLRKVRPDLVEENPIDHIPLTVTLPTNPHRRIKRAALIVPRRLPTKFADLLEYRADRMRHEPTVAERKMAKQMEAANIIFETQVPIGWYIADFVIPSNGIVVEVDGFSHWKRTEYDEKRTDFLKQFGFRVFRYLNQNLGYADMSRLQIVRDDGWNFTEAIEAANVYRESILDKERQPENLTSHIDDEWPLIEYNELDRAFEMALDRDRS